MRYLHLIALTLLLAAAAQLPAATRSTAHTDRHDVSRAAREHPRNDSTEQADADAENEEKERIELTLERLFPEKSFFGPSAHSTAFSHDGRYAAYLYRPYVERRHGNDIWLYDTETGEVRRLTSVSVMARFQEATRKVREDRIKKAERAGHGKEATKAETIRTTEQVDADDEAVLLQDVSGEWQGVLSGGRGEFELPPAGLPFVLHLQAYSDGSVSGTVVTALATATITAGRYDIEARRLECTLTEPESGMQGVLSAVIDGEEMTGAVTVQEMDLKLELSATRATGHAAEHTRNEQNDSSRGEQQEQQQEEDDHDVKDEEKDDEKKIDLGDVVLDGDADDEKAPRYGGISAYVWSPVAHEMIFISGGDLYRYQLDDDSLSRLTRTQDGEYDVQYLPDGSGYTYRRGSALLRVSFDSSLIEQIDPQLPGGESMDGYRVSPDGTRLVFRTNQGGDWWGNSRQVSIINYRTRFAQVRQVARHMPDAPLPEVTQNVYLYDLTRHFTEESELHKVFTTTRTGARDMLTVPQWSPNSDAVTFAAYDQETDLVRILEARWENNGARASSDGSPDEANAAGAERLRAHSPKPNDARAVYRFLHSGGPNTPRLIEPHYLADGRRIVFLSEISGFRHLHTLDPTYEQLEQLTRGRFEVYPFHLSRDRQTMYVTSTKTDPAQLNIFAVDLYSGAMTRLDQVDGTYAAVAVSDDGNHILAQHIDFGSPRELYAINVADESTRPLTDSHTKEAHILTSFIPEYFSFKNRHGQLIHGRMFKPDDWTSDDKRPLLIYVYGGPLDRRNMITRGAFSGESYFFHYYMTHVHGYITCTIDPRGASGFGALFEKSNYEQVGRPQVEDLVDGGKWFIENHGVDPNRIGLHGWSFGGFQTQMCLYTEPDFFAAGIAGAGPTEWHNYNTWYSTGTVGPSRRGQTDLEAFSLLPLAKNLKARLLLVHGMEDSNVLYQDTVRVYRELLKAGKETLVELFLDPTGGHGLGGDVKAINRMRKYEEFFLRVLGTGEPALPNDTEVVPDDVEIEEDEAENEAESIDNARHDQRNGRTRQGIFWRSDSGAIAI